ncbi:MAG: Calx-beta domain-containing protein [Candidatus Parabeggiatoa sp.]|nr:Calx-beta domain-containing protein [Candidatus Parabeggiatoa sp.]
MTRKYSSAPLGSGSILGTTTPTETPFPQNSETGNDSFLRKVGAYVNSRATLTTVGAFAALFAANSAASTLDFSKSSYSVDESAGVAKIGVKLNCLLDENPGSVSAFYATSNDTAISGPSGDYTAVRGPLTWGSSGGNCDVTKSFNVPIQEDSKVEGDETVNLSLDNGKTAVLTILDNDTSQPPPQPSVFAFSQSNYSVDEGYSYGTTIRIARTQCGPDSPPISLLFTSNNGTATSEYDYNTVSELLTWGGTGANGDCRSKWFDVSINDDSIIEGNETVNLTLNNINDGAEIDKAVLTIIDDDANVVGFSQENYSINEDAHSATITIARTECLEGSSASVRYQVNPYGSTGASGSDYNVVSDRLTWEEGEGCEPKSFEVPILDDSDVEGDETVNLSLSYPSGTRLGKSSAILTIIDNESLPSTSSSQGQAILIAGIAGPKDTLFPYSNKYVQRMYSLLKERGFTDEEIHYMNPRSPDLDSDGYQEHNLQDYKLLDPEQELADAFDKASQYLQAGQQFVFYLHGHALQDHFRIKQDYELSAETLSRLLDKIPAHIEQVIMLDSCYSGSFIDDLKGNSNRIVLTSADAENRAWEIVGNESFSNKFISELRHGETVGEAFNRAKAMIQNDQNSFGNQNPWLDDDGDGLYTVTRDGQRAAETYLGRKGVHAAPPPKIVGIHPRIVLKDNTATATLWIKVIPNREKVINQVRAVLMKPNDLQFRDYQGEATDFARNIDLKLRYNGAQERYEDVYDYFCTEGEWRVSYQVQSKEGVWSDIAFGEVQQVPATQAPACLVPMTVKMGLNQTRYTAGNTLRLDMVLNGAGDADLYVAILFPGGGFMTLAYPDGFSFLNVIQPYLLSENISGQKVYPILNLPLPSGLASGNYSACGVLVRPNSVDVIDQKNWIHSDCPQFEMY